jgi:hypothetical protein
VSDYRIYVRDHAGHVVSTQALDTESEAAALERARSHVGGRAIELWQKDRLVRRFPPRPPVSNRRNSWWSARSRDLD